MVWVLCVEWGPEPPAWSGLSPLDWWRAASFNPTTILSLIKPPTPFPNPRQPSQNRASRATAPASRPELRGGTTLRVRPQHHTRAPVPHQRTARAPSPLAPQRYARQKNFVTAKQKPPFWKPPPLVTSPQPFTATTTTAHHHRHAADAPLLFLARHVQHPPSFCPHHSPFCLSGPSPGSWAVWQRLLYPPPLLSITPTHARLRPDCPPLTSPPPSLSVRCAPFVDKTGRLPALHWRPGGPYPQTTPPRARATQHAFAGRAAQSPDPS